MKFTIDTNHCANMKNSAGEQEKRRKKRKHIPHSERPLEAVQKRNERERQRVHEVNAAYLNLLNHLPELTTITPDHCVIPHARMASTGPTTSKTSKINILRQAIAYIESLSNILSATEFSQVSNLTHHYSQMPHEMNNISLSELYCIESHQEMCAISSNGFEVTELYNTGCTRMHNTSTQMNACMMDEKPYININSINNNKFGTGI